MTILIRIGRERKKELLWLGFRRGEHFAEQGEDRKGKAEGRKLKAESSKRQKKAEITLVEVLGKELL